jgi:hypothetical protein
LIVVGGLAIVTDKIEKHLSLNGVQLKSIFSHLSTFQIANIIEGILWVSIGIVLVVLGLHRTLGAKRKYLVVAGVLICFGVSDFVEAHTGAWWKPWWLLLWKASSVVFIAAILMRALPKPKPRPSSKS